MLSKRWCLGGVRFFSGLTRNLSFPFSELVSV
jgi:hypothetical protein